MLNKRLQTILDLIDNAKVVADIGSDHALLPIAIVDSNRATRVYACDVAQGPLNSAIANINKYKVEDKVIPILSNGLAKVPYDVDTIVIAGMGYNTIKMILEADIERLDGFRTIIIQSNNDLVELREWISNHHYNIVDEKIIFDRKYYTIIKINTKQGKVLNDDELIFGPILINNRSKEWYGFHQQRLNKLLEIYESINNDENRKKDIELLIKQYQRVLDK